eukprot:CAMPEP_0183442742 /NCGR_PEP_ID=MMETSP0370-20130417/89243_1 /TAXON_ID=268820 /ORGANISM="Peridinium aciculiferum, Strain PAER-2" /LENGTH=38 /DNA_ID= /DNA_START= /DNA_END= /DNA_ORIENTATION=
MNAFCTATPGLPRAGRSCASGPSETGGGLSVSPPPPIV